MSGQINTPIDPQADMPRDFAEDQETVIDRLVVFVSSVTAWLFPILMIAITTQVVMVR